MMVGGWRVILSNSPPGFDRRINRQDGFPLAGHSIPTHVSQMRFCAICFLALFLAIPCAVGSSGSPGRGSPEVNSKTFVGKSKFDRLMAQGIRENWRALPIGERTARVGMALVGTPYKNFTLEIDDRVEKPCVNMDGMDCWTFFEIALASARALKLRDNPSPADLLRLIELDRYRGGRCTGKFDSRLHHLEDWQQDNAKRGLVVDLTPKLRGAKRLNRNMNYMAKNWKNFRQLKADQSLIPKLAKTEEELSRRGIYYIPKSSVPAIERDLRDGDIISIVTTWPGTYTSHVGLAARDKSGTLRFLHASRDKKAVILDSRLSTYLNRYSKHAGIMVARPLDLR